MARKANSSAQTLTLIQALLTQNGGWNYGYDLSKQTGLKSGTLYPQLMRLEASGWLEAKWEEHVQPGRPMRHMYRLTDLGRVEGSTLLREVLQRRAVQNPRIAGPILEAGH